MIPGFLMQSRLAREIGLIFQDSSGALAPELQLMPSELAVLMRMRGVRGRQSESSWSSLSKVFMEAAAGAAELSDLDPSAPPPPPEVKYHASADLFKFKKGPRVKVKKPEGKVLSDIEFQGQEVYPGSFVVTRAAPSSHWGLSSKKIKDLPFWTWRVTKVHPKGKVLPGHTKPCADFTYEAHLFRPAKGVTGKWEPVFEAVGLQYLRTDVEKVKHKLKQDKKDKRLGGLTRATAKAKQKEMASPLMSLLRPGNVVGGGFSRTGGGGVPKFVRDYVERHVASGAIAAC